LNDNGFNQPTSSNCYNKYPVITAKNLEWSENFPQSMVPSIKPAIIKESFNQKKSEQNQRQNLIVDIAVNRCLLRTIELKLFCFNKTPEV